MKKALCIFLLCATIVLAGLIIADAQSFKPVLFKLSAIKDVSSVDPTDGYYLVYDGTAGAWGPGELVVPPSAPVFTDNFADADLYWAWIADPDCLDANRTITEAGGVLTIEVKNNAAARFDSVSNTAPKMITGIPGYPLEIIVKLNSYTVNTETAAGVFIAFRPFDTPLEATRLDGLIGMARFKPSEGGTDGIGVIDRTHSQGGIQDAAVTTLPIWFKIRLVDLSAEDEVNKILFYYSTDGSDYTLLHTKSDYDITGAGGASTADSLVVGIYAANHAIANNIAAPFEFFTAALDQGPGCP